VILHKPAIGKKKIFIMLFVKTAGIRIYGIESRIKYGFYNIYVL